MIQPYKFDVPQLSGIDPSMFQANPSFMGSLPQLRAPNYTPGKTAFDNVGQFMPQFGQLPTNTGAQSPGMQQQGLSQLRQPDAQAPQSRMPQQQMPPWLLNEPGQGQQHQSQIPPWLLQPPGQSQGGSGQPKQMQTPNHQEAAFTGFGPNMQNFQRPQMPSIPMDPRSGMPMAQLRGMQQPMQQPDVDLRSLYMMPPPPGGPQPFNQDTGSQIAQLMQLLGQGAAQYPQQQPMPQPGGQQQAPQYGPMGNITTNTVPSSIYSGQQMDQSMNALNNMHFQMPTMPGMNTSGAQGILDQMAPGYGSQAAGQFQNFANPANAAHQQASYGQAVNQGLGGASFLNNVLGSQLGMQGGQRDWLMSMLLPMMQGAL